MMTKLKWSASVKASTNTETLPRVYNRKISLVFVVSST